jgi:hypothetical protein
VPDDVEPKIDYAVQDWYLQQLPSPFPPLDTEEKETQWGQEFRIAIGFAHELDLYQALTAFRRAEFLLPPGESRRRLEMQYDILLCYYLGKKYADVAYTFEHSDLYFADRTFPAFEDLLIVLYDTYIHLDNEEKADAMLRFIQQQYPERAETLALSSALLQGSIDTLRARTPLEPYLQDLLTCYDADKKSVKQAQALNAVLPGAGYLYLGQKQSALTAFLLNGLFIAASVYFFHQGNVSAGVICTSFEAGWYFGGITGAGLEAKFYNERIYERCATPIMNQQRLFPVLMLRYAF